MSVIVQKDEINQIADALYWDAMGERQFVRVLYGGQPGDTLKNSSMDEIQDTIGAWTNRLYVSNQIAYIFTYSHRDDCDKTINQMDRSDWKNGMDLLKNPVRFYRMLESVRYNLISNGGQIMLSGQDMERLNDLIGLVARGIVYDADKKERGISALCKMEG